MGSAIEFNDTTKGTRESGVFRNLEVGPPWEAATAPGSPSTTAMARTKKASLSPLTVGSSDYSSAGPDTPGGPAL